MVRQKARSTRETQPPESDSILVERDQPTTNCTKTGQTLTRSSDVSRSRRDPWPFPVLSTWQFRDCVLNQRISARPHDHRRFPCSIVMREICRPDVRRHTHGLRLVIDMKIPSWNRRGRRSHVPNLRMNRIRRQDNSPAQFRTFAESRPARPATSISSLSLPF